MTQSKINCKSGSVKSLSTAVEKIIGSDPVNRKKAFAFAQSVYKEYGENFTPEDANKHFVVIFGEGKSEAKAPKEKKLKKEVVSIPVDGDAADIINSELELNKKIRSLLQLQWSVAQIKNALDSQFTGLNKAQRIRNVRKNMLKVQSK